MNYEPLIERQLDAIPAAAHAFLDDAHTAEELWMSVTRFAVLAYAPSQHLKRAVMACHAAWVVRESIDFVGMIIECARYAAQARQPWSEPPILDEGPPIDPDALRRIARGDARLMLDTALALEPLLGEKGRYALLRMPKLELEANPDDSDPSEPFDVLLARAVASRGAVDAVRDVLLTRPSLPPAAHPPLTPYPLARDYAQTLLVHAFAPHPQLIDAVHDNLAHGESFADWSLA